MHHLDAGYDVSDPAVTPRQRALLEFSEHWFNAPQQLSQHSGPGCAVPYEGNPALTRLHPATVTAQPPAPAAGAAAGAGAEAAARVVLLPGWSGPRGRGVVPFVSPTTCGGTSVGRRRAAAAL